MPKINSSINVEETLSNYSNNPANLLMSERSDKYNYIQLTPSKNASKGSKNYSPASRTYIIGAITDFHDRIYAKVFRSDNDDNVKYESSVKAIENENEYLLHYLTKFLTTNTSQFGYNRLEPLPKDIRIHDTLLGTGPNSMVFNCLIDKHEPNQYALKISNKPVNKEVLSNLLTRKYYIVILENRILLKY
ncbi:unnamed protein product [Didymodactylos carnosus]|uniref:Protein kinase domain-containing protein n=1 Tax=Didymodactylos carnosus TaxID=1234261 RepID=A0A815FKD3_9BILA|nr:unnamed protein product [Didymodactylos carnosus]CAF1326535.1 unnamed protein product [Didymodactylos carnosus]CAF4022354.1 unnamed protein product [Didymodactylos carnosus]CAF4176727.1 unnamed protein product [Didymodactylos carnosus]